MAPIRPARTIFRLDFESKPTHLRELPIAIASVSGLENWGRSENGDIALIDSSRSMSMLFEPTAITYEQYFGDSNTISARCSEVIDLVIRHFNGQVDRVGFRQQFAVASKMSVRSLADVIHAKLYSGWVEDILPYNLADLQYVVDFDKEGDRVNFRMAPCNREDFVRALDLRKGRIVGSTAESREALVSELPEFGVLFDFDVFRPDAHLRTEDSHRYLSQGLQEFTSYVKELTKYLLEPSR